MGLHGGKFAAGNDYWAPAIEGEDADAVVEGLFQFW